MERRISFRPVCLSTIQYCIHYIHVKTIFNLKMPTPKIGSFRHNCPRVSKMAISYYDQSFTSNETREQRQLQVKRSIFEKKKSPACRHNKSRRMIRNFLKNVLAKPFHTEISKNCPANQCLINGAVFTNFCVKRFWQVRS